MVELDDSHVRFTHPLLASICYEQAPVWKRRAVHRALAGRVTDAEERARHLALAADGPDAVVASELETAADAGAARGAPAAAAELFELAAELTPDDPALTRHRRLQAANVSPPCGRRRDRSRDARTAPRGGSARVERADVLFELAWTPRPPRTLIELCDEALVEAAGDDVRS